MTPRERLLAVLNLKEVDRVPVAQPLQTGTLELMASSGTYWPDAHRNPGMMARLAYAAHTIAGFESVRVPFDLNVESEALGCRLDYHQGVGQGMAIQPSVRTTSVGEKTDLYRIVLPNPQTSGRMPVVIQAVDLLSRALKNTGNDLPIFAAAVAPFTLAGQIRGVDKLLRDLIKDPAFVHELLEKCCETSLRFALALVRAGADVIVLIDATASPDLVSPKYYREFAQPYAKRVAKQLAVPTILHICGNSTTILDSMAEVSHGVSVDASVDIRHLKQVLGHRGVAVGNIDVNATLLFGSGEEIEHSVRDAITAGTDILTTSCGIAPGTPSTNLIAMVQAGKNYGKR